MTLSAHHLFVGDQLMCLKLLVLRNLRRQEAVGKPGIETDDLPHTKNWALSPSTSLSIMNWGLSVVSQVLTDPSHQLSFCK